MPRALIATLVYAIISPMLAKRQRRNASAAAAPPLKLLARQICCFPPARRILRRALPLRGCHFITLRHFRLRHYAFISCAALFSPYAILRAAGHCHAAEACFFALSFFASCRAARLADISSCYL